MRILHVIESLEYGGAEKVVVHLANCLAETHKITLCLVKYRGELVTEVSPEVEIVYLDLGEGLHAGLPRKLAGLIEMERFDIVHVHNWAIYLEAVFAVFLARRAMVIQTVHGPYTDYGNDIFSKCKQRLRHLLEYWVTKSDRVGKIVTVSDSIRHYISRDIGIDSTKLQTIHNGIAAIDFEPLNFDGPVKFITVGRLAAIKNHKLMIGALADCRSVNDNLYLTIVGDGPEKEALEEFVSDCGLEDRVSLPGFRDDITELLAAHDVFLLSSDYEGISIALLESMSLSRPSIATDVGGIPETIDHERTGLLVPKGNRKLFANAMLTLASSPKLRFEMGVNARDHFLACFHEEKVVDEYLSLYRQVAG